MPSVNFDVYKNVEPSNVLPQLYDKWLCTDHLNSQFRDYSHYHPSDLGYCIRKAILEMIDAPANRMTVPRLQRIFETGHSTHARFQEHFGEMAILYGRWICDNCGHVQGKENKIGIPKPTDCPNCKNPTMTPPVVDNEGRVLSYPKPIFHYKELPVRHEVMGVAGHTDGVLQINGKFYIVDFKTCSPGVFNDICEVEEQPIEAHVFQINTYMYILGVDEGFLLYENRGDLNLKEFKLKKDYDVIKEVMLRIQTGNQALNNKTIPDIPQHLSEESVYCKGFPGLPPCPFFQTCFPDAYNRANNQGFYDKFVKINTRLNTDV